MCASRIAPPSRPDAIHRQQRAWITVATVLTVAYSLLNSGCTQPREPERLSEAAAADHDAGQKSGNAPRPLLSADALFAQASPAVVQVVIQDRQGRPLGGGSGFLVSPKGLIVTNYHVIEKAHTASVVLADKAKLDVAGAAALDQEADLAILKVAGPISTRPLELAGSDLPPVGTKVYAIGSPLGLAQTLSDGLVSGHRETDDVTLIQTTAPISPGSSGGPLLGEDGRIVGVTTAFLKTGQNLNFAVPASQVTRLLRRCEDEGRLTQFPLIQRPVANRGERGRPGGPVAEKSSSSRPAGPVVLTRDEKAKCGSHLRIKATPSGPFVEGYLYNGTKNMTITKVVYVIDTGKWTREYEVEVNVKPLATQNISMNIGPPGLRLQLQAFVIKSLTGVAVRP
jgi:S1-C subfamily serine protease